MQGRCKGCVKQVAGVLLLGIARACSAVNLVDDDAVGAARAHDSAHLHRISDARHERGRSPVVAGIDLQWAVPAMPCHHMRQRCLSQSWMQRNHVSIISLWPVVALYRQCMRQHRPFLALQASMLRRGLLSKGQYPQCLATTCASVVFSSPAGQRNASHGSSCHRLGPSIKPKSVVLPSKDQLIAPS